MHALRGQGQKQNTSIGLRKTCYIMHTMHGQVKTADRVNKIHKVVARVSFKRHSSSVQRLWKKTRGVETVPGTMPPYLLTANLEYLVARALQVGHLRSVSLVTYRAGTLHCSRQGAKQRARNARARAIQAPCQACLATRARPYPQLCLLRAYRRIVWSPYRCFLPAFAVAVLESILDVHIRLAVN
jgi:hypothetical protein